MNTFDIIFENIGTNTEYCFDSNGNDEFKCECNEGFDGKRCEDECSLRKHKPYENFPENQTFWENLFYASE